LRENNEDSFLIDTNAGLLVVADGMGGHQSGELASADTIRVMQEFLLENTIRAACDEMPLNGSGSVDMAVLLDHPSGDCSGRSRIATAIATANDAINNLNYERGYSAREAMSPTIVGLYVQPDQPMDATIFHVGDSRFNLYRDGALNQITRDHSAYENWLVDGSRGPAPSFRILSQAIGPSE